MNNTPEVRSYVPSLNGLRAISIVIVIISHINDRFFLFQVPFPFTTITDGNFGVNIFFVISGFLITTLLIEEENNKGTINLKFFYIRRMFRIFPAYYFLLLFYFVLQLFQIIHFTTQSWLSSIFYYKYWVPGDYETAHFWSLSIEEHFYLLWPLFFKLFKKQRLYFALSIILIVFLFRYNSYYDILAYPIIKSWVFIFQRVDAIMIGCLFAMYQKSIMSWLDKGIKLKFVPVFLILMLFLNSEYFVMLSAQYKFHLGFLIIPLGLGLPIGTITNVLIAILVLFSISNKNWWYTFLNFPFMNFIGKLSYSLYLWQQIFLISNKLGVLNKLPINIFLTIMAALLSYYFIELPFLRYKIRFETKNNNIYSV